MATAGGAAGAPDHGLLTLACGRLRPPQRAHLRLLETLDRQGKVWRLRVPSGRPVTEGLRTEAVMQLQPLASSPKGYGL